MKDQVWEPRRDERDQFHAIEWDGKDNDALLEFLRRWVSEEADVIMNDTIRLVSLPGRVSTYIRPGDMVLPDHVEGYPGIRTLDRATFLRKYQEAELAPEVRLDVRVVELVAAVMALAARTEDLARAAMHVNPPSPPASTGP